MDVLIPVLAIVTALGSGAVGGVFFAFSDFVMRALSRLPSAQGAAAMQEINVTVLNPRFLGLFMGTAVLSLASCALAGWCWSEPWAAPMVAGGALYFLGTFLVTGMCNVPLNETLARVDAGAAEADAVWQHYAVVWTRWNHVRTVAALLAVVAFGLALVRLP